MPEQKTISIPSKTFLLGEYAVLAQGPAIVAAHQPSFKLQVNSGQHAAALGIHPASPSGQLIKDSAYLSQQQLEFIDPHPQGGFGASSAQFLGLLKAQHPSLTLDEVLEIFWQYHASPRPSGADIAAQAQGGIIAFHYPVITPLTWPFDEVDFLLCATGKKVATHQHLAQLNLEHVSDLVDLSEAGLSAWQQSDDQWLEIVNEYQHCLATLALSSQHTQELISTFTRHDWIRAAKGCGALGADVVMLVFPRELQSQARALAQSCGCQPVAHSADIAWSNDEV